MRNIGLILLPFLLVTAKTSGQTSDTVLNLHFESGKSTPIESELKAAESLLTSGNATVDSVYGYADSVGSAEYNLGLSARRCTSVMNLLRNEGVTTQKSLSRAGGNRNRFLGRSCRVPKG